MSREKAGGGRRSLAPLPEDLRRTALAEVAEDAEQEFSDRVVERMNSRYDDPWFPANQEDIPEEYAPSGGSS